MNGFHCETGKQVCVRLGKSHFILLQSANINLLEHLNYCELTFVNNAYLALRVCWLFLPTALLKGRSQPNCAILLFVWHTHRIYCVISTLTLTKIKVKKKKKIESKFQMYIIHQNDKHLSFNFLEIPKTQYVQDKLNICLTLL